jgi:hypothetical protein
MKHPRFPQWLWRRLGRRGSTLVLIALIDLTFGWYYLSTGPGDVRSAATLFLASVAPLWFWAALWAGVGVVCLQQAFGASDKIGFGCAVLLKVLWALLHLGGTLAGDLSRGYLNTVLWLVAAGWVYIISTWPEATRPEPPGPPVAPRVLDGD